MTACSSSQSDTQPVLFIPHGAGPCFFMDWQPTNTWEGMADFLTGIHTRLPERPKAILIISAHWQAPEFTITTSISPDLIYDYYGFPDHTYQLTYPVSGDSALADQVSKLLNAAGIQNQQDASRGLDHGVFIPLKMMFPKADIPVVQLSLHHGLDPQMHLAAGQALAVLRQEGVLIVGSGMSFHNMRGYGDAHFTVPSERFDDWLTQAIESDSKQRDAAITDWSMAPYALDSHPLGAEEHLLPLMVIAGAAGGDKGNKIYSQQVLKVQLSAFQFG